MEIKAILEAPYTEEEKVEFIVENNHNKGYEIRGQQPETLEAWGQDEADLLASRKQERLAENETIREAFLVEGVTYKDVLFDSDLEQKLNIMATVNAMSETDTITWIGKDGITSLECTKEDLVNIGTLLTKMTTYVWQYRNPEIKLAIENAKTLEEVNAIDISYEQVKLEDEKDNLS